MFFRQVGGGHIGVDLHRQYTAEQGGKGAGSFLARKAQYHTNPSLPCPSSLVVSAAVWMASLRSEDVRLGDPFGLPAPHRVTCQLLFFSSRSTPCFQVFDLLQQLAVSPAFLWTSMIDTTLAFSDEAQAFAFEKYLKSGSGRAFAKKRLWSSPQSARAPRSTPPHPAHFMLASTLPPTHPIRP
jgi:hypothetical protein